MSGLSIRLYTEFSIWPNIRHIKKAGCPVHIWLMFTCGWDASEAEWEEHRPPFKQI